MPGQKIPVGNVHPATSYTQEPEPDGLREAPQTLPFDKGSCCIRRLRSVRPRKPGRLHHRHGVAISIYRISQDSRILIDRAAPIEIWSRWLPVCWGSPQPIEGKGVMPEHDSITWSASPLQDSNSIRVTLNPGSGAPPVDFLSEELATAIITIGLPTITRLSRLSEFPEHRIGHIPLPLLHNNRFHPFVSGGRGD